MRMVTQHLSVYKSTMINRSKTKSKFEEIINDIPSRSPLFDGVQNKQTFYEIERKKRLLIEKTHLI